MSNNKTKPLLTEKQENFALAYIMNGGDASKAYREAYDVGADTKPTTIWKKAHEILHSSKVRPRVDELRAERYSGHIMTVEERKRILTEWIQTGDGRALDMLNKMEGVYTEKIDIKSTQEVHYYAPKKDKTK